MHELCTVTSWRNMCLYVHGEDVIETNKILQIFLEEFVCIIN